MIRSLAVALALAGGAAHAAGLPPGFVYLRDVAPRIAQDIRYASSNNFVGHPLPGYGAAECVLRREAALALGRVADDLARSGLALKTYDCYRPVGAVAAMVRWTRDPHTTPASKRFFPNLPKSALLDGYIAAHSNHSRGNTVDLTVTPADTPIPAFDARAGYGPCTAPATERAPDNSLDMGTGFDCLDPKANTASPAITPEQRRRRLDFVAAMRRRGFRNYPREWWHFTYSGLAGAPAEGFPIPPHD